MNRYTDQGLNRAVADSKSYAATLKALNLKGSGSSQAKLKKRIQELGINTSHFTGSRWNKGLIGECPMDIFVQNSMAPRTRVRRAVLTHKLIPYQCSCGNKGFWREEKLTLQLEHKNGIGNDNRLSNLEFLCPNCHSQTETFCAPMARRKQI